LQSVLKIGNQHCAISKKAVEGKLDECPVRIFVSPRNRLKGAKVERRTNIFMMVYLSYRKMQRAGSSIVPAGNVEQAPNLSSGQPHQTPP
jgi:hypothetical protein